MKRKMKKNVKKKKSMEEGKCSALFITLKPCGSDAFLFRENPVFH
jgi:hypothetical protein